MGKMRVIDWMDRHLPETLTVLLCLIVSLSLLFSVIAVNSVGDADSSRVIVAPGLVRWVDEEYRVVCWEREGNPGAFACLRIESILPLGEEEK